LICQGLRRSAAAAHAKGPARPVVQSAFRAKGLWRGNWLFLKFLAIIVAPGGASLSDERSEEMTNREGVAAGGATYLFVVGTNLDK